MTLDAKIESLLFFKGESLSLDNISRILSVSSEQVTEALDILDNNLSGRGIVLLRKDDEIMLGTEPQMSEIIEGLIKEDLNKEIGKAGLETLSIVLYLGPVTRSRIDYVRGVNSNFILRNLLIRGLVEKITNPNDQRSFLYKPTFKLLSHLGVSKIEDLPEYLEFQKEIENSEKIIEEEKGGESETD